MVKAGPAHDPELARFTAGWSCYTSDPEPTLEMIAAARAKCPVAYSDEHEGFFMLLGNRDVRKAMLDHRTFSSEPQVLRPMLPRKAIPALEMDPPRHREWRSIFDAAVTPKSVAAMEGFLRADIRAHIARVASLGRCDIVKELCEPVPAEAVCHLVGIDADKVPPIREAALAMFAAQGDPELFGKRQAEFGALTVSEVHERKARPRDDFMTSLAGLQVEGRSLDDDDYVVLLAAFLGAGHHSTTSAMGSLIYDVFSDAGRRDSVASDPARLGVAIEESLRLHPPFYGFYRRTTHPVEIGDIAIDADTDVYVGWAAANRDPATFESPDEFRLDREHCRHLSFGLGIHTCPGAPLARLELKILLQELLAALPELRIEGPAPEYRFGGGDYAFIPELVVTSGPYRDPAQFLSEGTER